MNVLTDDGSEFPPFQGRPVIESAKSPATATVYQPGREKASVVCIDGAMPDPEALRADAIGRSYRTGGYYPGIRSELPPATIASVIDIASNALRDHFGIIHGHHRILLPCYGLLTTPPNQLALAQRIPHIDGVEKERIALLLYLGPPELGGTAFYRHRATGFETIGPGRLNTYLSTLKQEFRTSGVPQPAYISGHTPLYEQTLALGAAYNRLLIYRGHMLHCADLPTPELLCPDPRHGRLTINIFLMGNS